MSGVVQNNTLRGRVFAVTGKFAGVNVVRDLLRVSPSNIVESTEDFTICRCRIHAGVQHAECDAGQGCTVWPTGTQHAIAAAGRGERSMCLAEPGVRKNDARFVLLVREYAGGHGAFSQKHVPVFVRRYGSGAPLEVMELGTGYCYMAVIRPEFRMRVARVLGPLPYLIDVLRVGRLVGCVDRPLRLVRMPSGAFHIERDEGYRGNLSRVGMNFFHDSIDVLLTYGTAVRVGITDGSEENDGLEGRISSIHFHGDDVNALADLADRGVMDKVFHNGAIITSTMLRTPEGVYSSLKHGSEVMAWLHINGIVLPSDSWMDLSLALRARVGIVNAMQRVRARVLAQVGDSAMQLVMVQRGLRLSQTAEQISQQLKRLSNARFIALYQASPLCGWSEYGPTDPNSKVTADMFEALAGVISWHCGSNALTTFMKLMQVVDDGLIYYKEQPWQKGEVELCAGFGFVLGCMLGGMVVYTLRSFFKF